MSKSFGSPNRSRRSPRFLLHLPPPTMASPLSRTRGVKSVSSPSTVVECEGYCPEKPSPISNKRLRRNLEIPKLESRTISMSPLVPASEGFSQPCSSGRRTTAARFSKRRTRGSSWRSRGRDFIVLPPVPDPAAVDSCGGFRCT